MQDNKQNAGVCEASLTDVICTEALRSRPTRAPNHAAENLALVKVAQLMAHSPREILQTLTDVALELCRAGSAGISILEGFGREEVFRWRALSGELSSHLGETTPRDFSPCGVVVDREALQLMRWLARHFHYFAPVRPYIVETLLVPFKVDGKTIGTVWVVIHNEHDHFDAEDARLLENLGTFTAAAYQLRTALESSREVDRRKDEFLAMVVHELRNPLAAASTASHVVERRLKVLMEPQLEAMHHVNQRQLKSMSRMIDDLLDVARIRLDKLELRKEVVTIGPIVEEAVAACRTSLENRAHELVVSVPGSPLWIEVDPVRMTQVVSNLLNNAVKYTPSGGRIELTVEEGDGRAVLSVRDNGIGLSESALTRIFDLFAQVEGTPARTQDGLGIGLALVKRLVEFHGGGVEAKSPGLGQGSEFTVFLPLVEPIRAAPNDRASAVRRISSANSTMRLAWAAAAVADDGQTDDEVPDGSL